MGAPGLAFFETCVIGAAVAFFYLHPNSVVVRLTESSPDTNLPRGALFLTGFLVPVPRWSDGTTAS